MFGVCNIYNNSIVKLNECLFKSISNLKGGLKFSGSLDCIYR